jgi:hypothetical protein
VHWRLTFTPNEWRDNEQPYLTHAPDPLSTVRWVRWDDAGNAWEVNRAANGCLRVCGATWVARLASAVVDGPRCDEPDAGCEQRRDQCERQEGHHRPEQLLYEMPCQR